MTAGKVLGAAGGALFALLAFGLLLGGGAILWGYETQRSADGFFESPTYLLSTGGYAVTTSAADLSSHPGDWWPVDPPATVRLRVRSDGGAAVFVGIGDEKDVASYLGAVAREEIMEFDESLRDLETMTRSGGAPSAPPQDQGIWVASSQGEGEQILDWDLEQGRWSAVIMNADGSSPVSIRVVAGADVPMLRPIGIGLVVAGIFFAGLASLLLIAATKRASGSSADHAGARPGSYPAQTEGRLDASLSPALWLIKWFLTIPHMIVLAFLWAILVVLTFFAWIAILFTGRYPRGIFEFNVGVMRWSWRVWFYAYGTLGTDRYPPFSLQDVEYPARFTVAYPERLSRGLALIKWWLLAVPHYIIVGLFTSGFFFWTQDLGRRATEQADFRIGCGLITILVLIAGFGLLFTGRYSRGLFNLVMGLNRWVLRVAAYVTLMTDEYPPFRLDMGPGEPVEAEGTLGGD